MRKLWVFLLLMCVSLTSAQKEGQALVDSLLVELSRQPEDTSKVSLLNTLSFTYQNIDPYKGKVYGKRAMFLAQKLQWTNGLASAYRNIGINESVNSNYKAALAWYFKGLELRPSKKTKSDLLRSIGLVYTFMTEYDKALDYDMRALQLSETIGDRRGQAAVLSNIGIVYYDLMDFKKAVAYYEKARRINEEMGNLIYLSNNLGNLGNCSLELRQYEKAIDYYQKAIAINQSLGDLDNEAINLGEIASVYFKLGDYDKALQFTRRSQILNQKTGNERGEVANIALTADVKLALAKKTGGRDRDNLIREAIAINAREREIFARLNDRNGLASVYDQLSHSQELLGNYKLSLDYYRLSVAYKDSVFNSENKETIKNLEDKRSIDLRDKQIELNKLTLKAKDREMLFYLFGIGALIVIGALLFWQNKNRQKSNRKLTALNAELDQANQTKTKLFSIIGHDLRGPVSHIYQFLELQKTDPDIFSEADKIRHNDRITAAAGTLLETMEDLLIWSKSQMQQFSLNRQKFDLGEVVSGISALMQSQFDKKNVVCENTITDFFVVSDRNIVTIIVRNILQNALNASPEGSRITIGATSSGKETRISIADNGTGMPQNSRDILTGKSSGIDSAKSGLGLSLVFELGVLIGARFEIANHNPSGTVVVILL